MHASEGIKRFKEKAVAAMFKEYKQLDGMQVVVRVAYDKLSQPDHRKEMWQNERTYVAHREHMSREKRQVHQHFHLKHFSPCLSILDTNKDQL